MSLEIGTYPTAVLRSKFFHLGDENPLLGSLLQTEPCAADESWTPLLLFGESGAGKSYVALSLAEHWLEQSQERFVDQPNPIVTTASDLARRFTPSRLSHDESDWLLPYEQCSLLVIDDVQNLVNRPLADNCLSSLLDYRNSSCLPSLLTISSMDCLSQLSRRLCSRLAAGLAIRLSLPSETSRYQLVEDFAARLSFDLDDNSSALLVARTAGLSVAGIWNTVKAFALQQPEQDALDPSSLGRSLPSAAHDLPAQCIRVTARRFGVRVADVKSSSRRKNTVLARSIAMFLIREFGGYSLIEVGRFFQNRDHTTVRHACQKIKRSLSTDKATQVSVRSICATLKLPANPAWFHYPAEECA